MERITTLHIDEKFLYCVFDNTTITMFDINLDFIIVKVLKKDFEICAVFSNREEIIFGFTNGSLDIHSKVDFSHKKTFESNTLDLNYIFRFESFIIIGKGNTEIKIFDYEKGTLLKTFENMIGINFTKNYPSTTPLFLESEIGQVVGLTKELQILPKKHVKIKKMLMFDPNYEIYPISALTKIIFDGNMIFFYVSFNIAGRHRLFYLSMNDEVAELQIITYNSEELMDIDSNGDSLVCALHEYIELYKIGSKRITLKKTMTFKYEFYHKAQFDNKKLILGTYGHDIVLYSIERSIDFIKRLNSINSEKPDLKIIEDEE